ncbi:MAG: YggS family pyridoxal phosphate-dependent enzyme [Candidatus Atribacteria bacterium]|nr:YggS family pyridoxal phosphate-dependent enzyme [Candidatus Atribacteria bacterium]
MRENLEQIREKIGYFAQKAGRRMEEIKIVAVTKGVGVEKIEEAIAGGICFLGENRLQEALPKILRLSWEGIEWHFVGRLQTNKVKKVVQYFHAIQSVDRPEVVVRIKQELENLNRGDYPIFIQVNLTGKETQGGISERDFFPLLEHVALWPCIRVVGLMTIGPQADEKEIRRVFGRLRELRDEVNRRGIFKEEVRELSMGMSDDFHWAILEGATILRLGRALFGER